MTLARARLSSGLHRGCPLNARRILANVKSEEDAQRTIDLRRFKEALRRRLPAGSPVLSDLLLEPDSMPVGKAEVLIPSYLDRLERELEKGKAAPGIPALRA